MEWRGIIVSIKAGGKGGERDLYRLVKNTHMPFVVNPTRHPGIFIITPRPDYKDDPSPLIEAFLIMLRTGLIGMDPITLARPFNISATLGEYRTGSSIAYDPTRILDSIIPDLIPNGLRAIRIRARGNGIGIGDALRTEAIRIIESMGVRYSKRSSIVLNIEAINMNGVIRIYIGLFPKWLLVRYRTARLIKPSQ